MYSVGVRYYASTGIAVGRSGGARRQATAAARRLSPAVTHASFEAIGQERVHEYGLDVTKYKHIKSGAEMFSVVAPEDSNKVFGITFRTPPEDSTGIAHIMEHSVLCGSEKYTSKEPFVELLKGSLQTFLNAFTYPDRTCYPVASQNTQDFYNLVNVYIDAVLHPRAVRDPQVLQQEGWHIELEDANQPMVYKGVVYNEMRGVYSSPTALSSRHVSEALFPDNAYSHDYGGVSWRISDVSVEQFVAFHRTYYHPSNARIFFYGDDDVYKRLDLVDEYLAPYDAKPQNSSVTYQPLRNLSRDVLRFPYPVGGESPLDEADGDGGDAAGKHIVTVNWLLNDGPMTDVEELALGVVDHLLLGTSSSPLYKALIESRLGESVTGGGLSEELLQATFGVGLKGVKESDVSKVEALVDGTLRGIVNGVGFEKEAIAASVNSIEFAMREFNTGSFPKGLSVMLGLMKRWNYDREDAVDVLRFEEPLAELKAAIQRGEPVFENVVDKMLLKNRHRATVELYPDADLESRQQNAETAKLAKIREGMDSSELERVMNETRALREAQEREDTPEQRATIPRVGVDALTRNVETVPTVVSYLEDSVTLLSNNLSTSGILYGDVAFEIDGRTINSGNHTDDVALLGLYTRLLFESGSTSALDDVQLSRRIGTHTGGIGASILVQHREADDVGGVYRESDGADEMTAHLVVRGKAVRDKMDEMWSIMTDVLTDVNLDKRGRVLEMLRESRSSMESALLTSGHSIAATQIKAQSTVLGAYNDLGGGLRYLDRLPSLIRRVEDDWDSVLADLRRLHDSIVNRNAMTASLTMDGESLDDARDGLARFTSTLPRVRNSECLDESIDRGSAWRSALPLAPRTNAGIVIPTQVNYVSLGSPAFGSGTRVPGSSVVASRLLSRGFLWDNVRVLGGAYGAFFDIGRQSGTALFGSYRDPNIAETLGAYRESPAFLSNLATSEDAEEHIEGAVVGTIGDLDTPMTPQQKGNVALCWHLMGRTTQMRQAMRDEILDTTKSDIRSVAESLGRSIEKGTTVVVGSRAALEEANRGLEDAEKLRLTAPLE
eukprot:g4423.t1